jgi:hypothetical protein
MRPGLDGLIGPWLIAYSVRPQTCSEWLPLGIKLLLICSAFACNYVSVRFAPIVLKNSPVEAQGVR